MFNYGAALALALDSLRCAGEAGNGLSGQARDRVLSVMYLVALSKAFVTKSLDGLATH